MAGSWDLRGAQGIALLNRPCVLAPDVLGRELDIEHGGVNLGMPHQMLQRGQRDSGPRHISAKGMAEPMRIGVRNLAAHAMMAEQRAESGGSHGPATPAAFQGNEQEGRIGERPFQAQIFFDDFDDFRRQRQNAFLVSFAENPHLRRGQLEILELKGQYFAGTQTIEQHQTNKGEIAEGAKAAPELGDFLRRQGYNNAPGLP